jgi:hypothetical protein
MYIMDLSAMCGEVHGREEILPITGKELNVVNGSAVYGKHPDGKPQGSPSGYEPNSKIFCRLTPPVLTGTTS